MKKSKYEKWLVELQAELFLLNGEDIKPIDRLRHTLPLIANIINDMKAEVLKNGFAVEEEEIYFFKHIKPEFYALQLFEVSWHDLAIRKPVGTKEMVKAFFEDELLYILRFFKTNAFPYHYYKTGATELDDRYFTRDAQPGGIPILEIIDPLPGFSTTLDYTFAKFIAYERLQLYLIDQLSALFTENNGGCKQIGRSLKWTGESINLVELAYGIWLTGQINNGNATVTEIIEWLEEHLQVIIGTAHRRWVSISRRKRISQTKYLDQVKEAIIKRLDDENGLR
jgi:hypothetical protein